MADWNEEQLDLPHETLVREYLSAELDGQTGRAEARFREMLARRHAEQASQSYRLPGFFRGRMLGLVGAALAASLAGLWAGPALRQMVPSSPPTGGPVNVSPTPGVRPVSDGPFVEQTVQSQTFDDGTFLDEESNPVQILRRRDVEQTRWFNGKQQLQAQEVVPSDHVVYVKLKTY
jgi:hypothetical protein